ncbi:inner membrane protein YrbG [Dehalogenimonas sp. WBC-2]|nr:inner membrane protein YrbG [Dehalogenimonas sp. WBC-2]
MLTYVLFIIGFVFLVKGADYIVDGGSALGLRLKVSGLIIGLTVVAFGTSAPELMVSLFATSGDASQLIVGNIIGSNIANILLILGVAAIIFPIIVKYEIVWVQIPLSLLAIVTMGIMASDALIDNAAFSVVSRSDGIILLLFFGIFLYYTIAQGRRQRSTFYAEVVVGNAEAVPYSTLKIVRLIILGMLGLLFGGQWIVNGAVQLSNDLGWNQSFVGLTIVALGTSLPELATSVVAAVKKNSDIAVGNIVGSNIVNVFFVLAVSAIIKPLAFNSADYPGLIAAILASLLLFGALFVGRKRHFLVRKTGILFVTLYALFIAYSVIAA